MRKKAWACLRLARKLTLDGASADEKVWTTKKKKKKKEKKERRRGQEKEVGNGNKKRENRR